METFIILLLITAPAITDQIGDPSGGDRKDVRNLDCTRMSQARAHELYPGRIPEPAARAGAMAQVDALLCRPRVMSSGERSPRDEAILTNLGRSVGDVVEVAAALGDAQTVWHVDAYYPDAHVASKIATAARTGLAEGRRKVSDKVPLLAAGDLVVLRDLPGERAYPLACKRYFDAGALGENDAFLGVMLLDPKETQLHAGVCQKGVWRWLR